MASLRGASGAFTLIELIVVMALVSLLMVFAAPRLHQFSSQDQSRKASFEIIAAVKQLKQLAVQNRRRYTLHVDAADNRLWITHDLMSEDEREAAKDKNAVEMPGNINILDVEYPGALQYESADYHVNFYPAGYSDPAIIHIESDHGRRQSLVIQPFLPKTAFHDRYLGYEN